MHLCAVFRIGKSIETESRSLVSGAGKEGMGSGYEWHGVSLWGHENALE